MGKRINTQGWSQGQDGKPPQNVEPFASQDDLLAAAREMFDAREEMDRLSHYRDDEKCAEEVREKVQLWEQYWHGALEMTDDSLPFCAICSDLDLSEVEREILVALVLERLGLINTTFRQCGQLLDFLNLPAGDTIQGVRAMTEDGTLVQEGLIFFADPGEDMCDRRMSVDPLLVESFITGDTSEGGWDFESEKEVYEKLDSLAELFAEKVNLVVRQRHRRSSDIDLFKLNRRAMVTLKRLHMTLQEHSEWGVTQLLSKVGGADNDGPTEAQTVLLVLVCKEIQQGKTDDRLFRGEGLAATVSENKGDVREHLDVLRSDGKLIRKELVQPCGGCATLLDDDPEVIAETEFELSAQARELLGVEQQDKTERWRGSGVREPRMSFEQLVLSGEVRDALEMAVAQAQNGHVLMEDWGVGSLIPYGHAVTLLFSGPPGTGKTASAEALADRLQLPIMVANYAKVQNCFKGQTEKNVVKTFRDASRHNAVLFWDEADAMFYDRDSGQRSWEVRDVNVLLQELETFEGVCVLATNRKVSLDPALERRLSMKVEFQRPDRSMRRRIWEKLLPDEMPVAENIDMDRLASEELTGGEIKNVVLNAARMALVRGADTEIGMADFIRAIKMDNAGGWTSGDRQIGFAAPAS